MTECGKKKPKNPPRHRLALAKVCQLSLLSRTYTNLLGFLDGSAVKNLPANAGDARDTGSIPGLGKSPRVGNGNPLQYSCLEDFMDRGAWWATGHGVTESRTQLSTSLIVRRLPSHNLLHCFLSLLSFSIFNVITALQVSILM